MSAGYGARTPTQTAWLAGAAALVVMLLVGGGWLVWRGLGSAPSPLATPGGAASSLIMPVGEVGFGAPTVDNGVPWGYPLTPEGAAAAAVTAVAATGQPEAVFDPSRFAEVAAVVFTDEQATIHQQQVEAARTEFELSGWGGQPESRRLYFFTPLAVRLTAYHADPPSAQAEVWAMSLIGVGDAGGAVFTTSTVTLATADGTWTVTGLDSVEGPTPLVHGHATAPGRTRGLLRDALPAWPLPLPVGTQP